MVYGCLITLVGAAAGVLLLGESLTSNRVLGDAVIRLGVYLARRRQASWRANPILPARASG